MDAIKPIFWFYPNLLKISHEDIVISSDHDVFIIMIIPNHDHDPSNDHDNTQIQGEGAERPPYPAPAHRPGRPPVTWRVAVRTPALESLLAVPRRSPSIHSLSVCQLSSSRVLLKRSSLPF
ncbi:hypothetical protein CEXT_52631 [Caerostris extrusa]|uniref:Uncharacterized protein n=1 Tax=Caerostris extrusa TaxID=172846 RepID=A0AAV4NDL6_CAEEX|nr:hypothetical protein CEXT_52631 [Caerostris extrusa]